MFESLRRFLGEIVDSGQNTPSSRQFDEDDHRIAAAALLLHVADADGAIGDLEQKRIHALVAERFKLDTAAAARLIREALWSEHESVSIEPFVTILKRRLDASGRLKLVEMMWDVVYADGEAGETEDSTIWRIANMLDVPEHDQETLRRSRAPGHWPGDGSK